MLGPPCQCVQSKLFKEVELHIVPLWVCCYIADKKEAANADKKDMARVLFIIILEALDKKTQPVWLAVRRVRMLVGRSSHC